MLLADAVLNVGHWCFFGDLQQIVLCHHWLSTVMQLALLVTQRATLSLIPHAVLTLPADSVEDDFDHR